MSEKPRICQTCHGQGIEYSPGLYWGCAECSICEGTGEEPLTDLSIDHLSTVQKEENNE